VCIINKIINRRLCLQVVAIINNGVSGRDLGILRPCTSKTGKVDEDLGLGFGRVVRAADWHAGEPGSREGRPLYIWMYTPSVVSILGMDMCA
jgi:hypothetical protein